MNSATFPWPLRGRPHIRVAGRFPMKPEWRHTRYRSPTVALHLHDYHCRALLGRQHLVIRPGDLTLTPAGIVSQFDLPAAGFHWCIHFGPRGAAAGPTTRLRTHFHLGAAAAYVTDRLQRITESHQLSQAGRNGVLHEMMAATALQELLLWLATWESREQLALNRRNLAVLDRLHHTLDQQFRAPLALADLAREAGLSPGYLARLFRQRFGMTLGRYVLRRRIELARQLLATTRLPVKAVAAEVGIADPQYFNKQFRRIAGTSPTAARRAAQAPPPNSSRPAPAPKPGATKPEDP